MAPTNFPVPTHVSTTPDAPCVSALSLPRQTPRGVLARDTSFALYTPSMSPVSAATDRPGAYPLVVQPTVTVTESIPSSSQTASTVSASPFANENVRTAIIVGAVLISALIGLIVVGELLRRRGKRRKEISRFQTVELSSNLQDKGKTPDVVPEEAKSENSNSMPRPPQGQASKINGSRIPKLKSHASQHQVLQKRKEGTRSRNLWPFRSRRKTLALGPHVDPRWGPQSPQSILTSYQKRRSVSFERRVLECIPEECVEHLCEPSLESEIALAIGLAMQRTLNSDSLASSLHADSAPESPRSGCSDDDSMLAIDSSLPIAHEEQSDFGCSSGDDARGNQEDTTFNSSVTSRTGETSMDAQSRRSSVTSVDSDAVCIGEIFREQIFELKRVHTRSMQMNKAVLVSLPTKPEDNESISNLSLLVNPHPESITLDDSELEEILDAFGDSFSDEDFQHHEQLSDQSYKYKPPSYDFKGSTLGLIDFPSQPSFVSSVRFPSFL